MNKLMLCKKKTFTARNKMTPKSWIKYMYMFNTYACIKKSKKHHEHACAHVMSHKIVAHTNVSRFYYMYTINW